MSNDPVITGSHIVEGEGSHHDLEIIEKYEAPSTVDVFREFDRWRADRVMEVLTLEYPGHFWCVVSDRGKGIVKISIPVLMGIDHWFVINERTHDVTPGMVIYAGGEILERYGLKRGRMNVGAFLDARQKHSRLLMPNRKIPD